MARENVALCVLDRGFRDKSDTVDTVKASLLRDDRLKAGTLLTVFVVNTVLFAFLIPKDAGA
jgi:hypothetical protein